MSQGPWLGLLLAVVVLFGPWSTASSATATNLPAASIAGTNADLMPATNLPSTNAPPIAPETIPVTTPQPADVATPASVASIPPEAKPVTSPEPASDTSSIPGSILAALLSLASIGGFLLYQCGSTRAKNSGHTATLLLVGIVVAVIGYWIGGFAVQTGGVGDAHAALSQPLPAAERGALDHELGPVAFGHHWGLMGSAGFFLATDDASRNGIAALFLVQAAFLIVAVAAALGAAAERGRLLPLACCAYVVGVLIYPLLANWVWGGGWLAEMGAEFGLGHGFVDLGGACVVHETAGALALVIAVVLGPRHGRFTRGDASRSIPGHHVGFLLLGSILLLLSWMTLNALSSPPSERTGAGNDAGLAATNTLLAACGGLIASYLQAAWRKLRPQPVRLARGLLGGAVASSGCAGLIDCWAAFLIGAVAALLVQAAVMYLERSRIDDPVSAAAIHGAGGVWGVLATGLFANGSAGDGLNGVSGPVRGLFFGGAWHQLAAQMIGAAIAFAVIFLLGYACVSLVQRIIGLRAELTDELGGLDWPELGALGYQADLEAEPADEKRD
jgi:Amt family ammonium transporter